MNTNLIASYIRSALKILGAILVAHGYTAAGGDVNQMLNMPDIIGFAATGLGLLWSHLSHSAPASGSGGLHCWLIGALLGGSLMFSGCASAPTNAYKVESAADISVSAAMSAWGDYVAANHPPASQEIAVENAFEKYQSAELLAIDATANYTALASTNSSGAAASLSTASAAVAQSITDLVNLLQSFGVKL